MSQEKLKTMLINAKFWGANKVYYGPCGNEKDCWIFSSNHSDPTKNKV